MPECTLAAKRFLPKTVNEKNYFLLTKSLTFYFTKNQWTSIKLNTTKKTEVKVSKNKHTNDEDKKTNKYTPKLRYTGRTLLKLKNTK